MRVNSRFPMPVAATPRPSARSTPPDGQAHTAWSDTPSVGELDLAWHGAPIRGAMLGAMAMAGCTALAGCAGPGTTAWRIEPVYRSSDGTHTGTRDGKDSRQAALHAYTSLARMQDGEGRWDSAASAWRKAAALAPDDADIQSALGVSLARAQRVVEAIEAFSRAAALAPPSARALNNLGYALALGGHEEQASATLRQALALDPQHVNARANLTAIEHRLAARAAAPVAAAAAPVMKERPAAPAAFSVTSSPTVAPLVHSGLAVAATVTAMASTAEAQTLESPTEARPAAGSGSVVVTTIGADVAATIGTTIGTTVANTVATASTPPAAQAPAQAAAAPRIFVANGVGIDGAAAKVRSLLRTQGLSTVRLQNLAPYRQGQTVVQYREGFQAAAEQVARSLPGPAVLQPMASIGPQADVRVVLGHDRRAAIAACMASNRCAPGYDAPAAPAVRGSVLAQGQGQLAR